jgi:cobalamin-dependent methionine synthase I
MIIIGEKINATLKRAREIIVNRDAKSLLALAREQADAGANFIDVNVGTGEGTREDELEAMRWAVETIQKEVAVPLCIDSADPAVLEAGLAAAATRPCLINSTKGAASTLEAIVPLAKKYESLLVGLAMDETGIPKTVEGRTRACEAIAASCEKHGVPVANLFLDPLVVPVSTDGGQGVCTLETLREIKRRFPSARTTMGLSNISFGLPLRPRVNQAFMHMAVAAGLDSALMNPMDTQMIAAIRTAEVLMNRDRHCRRYIRAAKEGIVQ